MSKEERIDLLEKKLAELQRVIGNMQRHIAELQQPSRLYGPIFTPGVAQNWSPPLEVTCLQNTLPRAVVNAVWEEARSQLGGSQ